VASAVGRAQQSCKPKIPWSRESGHAMIKLVTGLGAEFKPKVPNRAN
jgi:hypothetical protein